MKVLDIKENLHPTITDSQAFKDIYEELEHEGFKLEFKLADRMQERGLSVRGLASLTGIRLLTINDLMNGKKGVINMYHISVIMLAMRITDIRDIVDIRIDPEYANNMLEETNKWKYANEMPEVSKRLHQKLGTGYDFSTSRT